jgi:hypothetical protein
MRENERAILEAAQGSGREPKGVDVTPPETPPAPPPPGADGQGTKGRGGGGPPSGEKGESIRRRMEELIEGTGTRGQRIPVELEELVRMIPT